MRKVMINAVLLWALATTTSGAQVAAPHSPGLFAVINGEMITEAQVRAAAAAELEDIEKKKMQADASFSRDKQAIYERTLSTIIEQKVVEAEASKRGLTTETFLASEIDRLAKVPTDQEVAAMWDRNKERANTTQADALPQIRAFLTREARGAAFRKLVQKLREESKVQEYLEPLRVSVATQGFPTKGPADAPVTIVEFSDFECPFCAQIHPTIQEVLRNYGDKVRLVYREFPLTNLHPHAQKAAEAALCANDQQKFWEMHDAMFQNNKELEVAHLKQRASTLGLETSVFNACLDSAKYAPTVASEVYEGIKAGVSSTPTLLINGRYLNGAQPYADIAKIIDEELRRALKPVQR